MITIEENIKFTPDLIISLIFVSSLIIVIVSDIEYMIILDEVIFLAMILIIVFSKKFILENLNSPRKFENNFPTLINTSRVDPINGSTLEVFK